MAKVAVVNAGSYEQSEVEQAVNALFDSLGGAKKYVPQNSKVLLKANLVRDMSAERAGTTNPAVLGAIAKLLKNECNASVIIGDSSGGFYTASYMKTVYKVCGLTRLENEGLAKLNDDFDFTNVNANGKVLTKIDITNSFLNADVVVNVGKLKTHSFTGFSGAAKNLFGLVPGLVKVEMHSLYPILEDFCGMLCDLERYTAQKTVLHVIDAIVGMEGAGPTNGKAKFIGKLFAGENPYEVDAVAVSVFDNPYQMPLLKEAVARGLLKENYEGIDCDVNAVKKDYIENYDRVKVVSNSTFMNMPRWLKSLMNVFLTQHVTMTRNCRKCRKCELHCPAKAIVMGAKKAKVDNTKCIRCFCCQELCPFDAVRIKKSLLLSAVRGLSHTKNKKPKTKAKP